MRNTACCQYIPFFFSVSTSENTDSANSSDSTLRPTAWNTVFQALWDYMPEKVLECFRYLPMREYARFARTRRIFNMYSKWLLAQKSAVLTSDEHSMDVTSVLGKSLLSFVNLMELMQAVVRANVSEDPKSRLINEEMVSEMYALTLAGHETTANTFTWLLWELAKHPNYQEGVRAEIVQKRAEVAARGKTDFTIEDLDGVSASCNQGSISAVFHVWDAEAAVDEGNAPHRLPSQRVASQDDVLPLAYPIVTSSGETISVISVSAGQVVMPNIAVYSRCIPFPLQNFGSILTRRYYLPEICGADAHAWDPMRYVDGRVDPAGSAR